MTVIMRQRAAGFAVAFALAACLAPTQPLADIGNYGVNIGTVAVDGTRAVINEGTFVRVLDITNPAAPVALGAVDVGAVPGALQLIGDYAYSAENTGRFSIVNVSNAASPTIASQLDWPDFKHTLWVRRASDYAYVAGCSGIRVIDIRNKVAPLVVTTLPAECVFSVAGDGGYLYVANSTQSSLMSIWSLATPSAPVLMGSGPAEGASAFHLANALTIFGDSAYVGQFDGTAVVDISDRTSPRLSSVLGVDGGGLAQSRGILQIGFWDVVQLWNLVSPTAPDYRVNVVGLPGQPVKQVASTDQFVFTGRTHSLWVTNMVTETASLVRAVTPEFGGSWCLARSGEVLFASTGPGFAALDISSPSSPTQLAQVPTRWPADLLVVDTHLYNLSAWGWLEIFDIGNPASPSRIAQEFEVGGDLDANRIAGDATRIVVCAGNHVILFSRNVNGTLTQRATITLPDTKNAVALAGSAVYIALRDGTLRTYDITNLVSPGSPSSMTIFSGPHNGSPNNYAEVVGTRLHLSFENRGYALLDVSSPLAPALLGTYASTSISGRGFSVDGNLVYHATLEDAGKKGLWVLDVTVPSAITRPATRATTSYCRDVLVDTGSIYTAEEFGAVRVRRAFDAPPGISSGVVVP